MVGLFLISDCLLASWTFTPHVYRSVQSKIQGDAVVALQSSLSVQPPFSGILAASGPSALICLLFSARLTLLGSVLEFPSLTLSLEAVWAVS